MLITLTPRQWTKLKAIVKAGKYAERQLDLPVEIDNGDQKIEISAEEVKITLAD